MSKEILDTLRRILDPTCKCGQPLSAHERHGRFRLTCLHVGCPMYEQAPAAPPNDAATEETSR